MPPPGLPGINVPGKTLHQRTKSTPALSSLLQLGAVKAANKKVLGEINANVKILQPAKDDSEVGKASPGKIAIQESIKSAAPAAFARPATRPLAPKTISAQNVPMVVPTTAKSMATTQTSVLEVESGKRVVAKKSTKSSERRAATLTRFEHHHTASSSSTPDAAVD